MRTIVNFARAGFLLFSFSVLLFSCSGNRPVDDGIYFQDFDNLRLWDRNILISDEKAHSGKYSIFTDSLNEFSQTFEMTYNDAMAKGFKKISAKGWCLKGTSDTKAVFVLSIDGPDKNIAYASVDLGTFLKSPDSWEEASAKLIMPTKVPSESKIKVYLWSPNRQKAFMDDVEIKFSK